MSPETYMAKLLGDPIPLCLLLMIQERKKMGREMK
jgi:hypothetical protein